MKVNHNYKLRIFSNSPTSTRNTRKDRDQDSCINLLRTLTLTALSNLQNLASYGETNILNHETRFSCPHAVANSNKFFQKNP